jgi:hypothetical protein
MRAHTAIGTTLLCMCLAFGAVGANAADGASMQVQMQRAIDRQAIEDLLITYGRLLDAEDYVGYSKLFAKDGVWEGGIGSAKGPAEIQGMLDKVFSRVDRHKYGAAFHIMSNITVSVTGDTAASWSRWTWFVEGADGKPAAQRSGHYEDKLVREGGQWRFQHRLTVTELPTAAKDSEAQVFRKDHRAKD